MEEPSRPRYVPPESMVNGPLRPMVAVPITSTTPWSVISMVDPITETPAAMCNTGGVHPPRVVPQYWQRNVPVPPTAL